ncbi:Serine proteinase stubble [Portunus trituberculatus]|uniref:Serine proteinase stubble n=1 Tax=Portunus trituberculatus TaxID=210409 RepID=A0A5B7EQ21_PORTR|nr:Serine proteinase stubble [Portunus trituberculatus]
MKKDTVPYKIEVNSVRLGDLDLAKEGEANSRPADYDIELIIIHPNFTEDTQTGIRYNDLALLKTKTKIQFNEAVYPFCISRTRPAVNTTVTVSGYGYVNDSHQPTHLQEGELQVMSLDDCVAEYRTKNRYDMLQSAYPGLLQGYGVGDEGGPMLRKDESGRQHLEGIISFTADVCGPGVLPSISTSHNHTVPHILKGVHGWPHIQDGKAMAFWVNRTTIIIIDDVAHLLPTAIHYPVVAVKWKLIPEENEFVSYNLNEDKHSVAMLLHQISIALTC